MPDAVTLAAVVYLTKGFTTPVANAIGRLVSDPINTFAANNRIKILEKSKGRYALNSDQEIVANPKVILKILEEGGFEEDSSMQELWAGLLVSSKNDSNLHYVEILSNMSKVQALLLTKACSESEVGCNMSGLLYSIKSPNFSLEELNQISGIDDINEIDQALDDLRRKELIMGGFDVGQDVSRVSTNIHVTPLALHFYARVMGHSNSAEFFEVEKPKELPSGTGNE